MEEFGVNKFSGNRIARAAGTQLFTGRRIARFRISALNHKVFDNTVKEQVVEITLVYQLDKIVPVFGGFVVEFDFDFAHGGFHQDISFFYFGMNHINMAGDKQ